MGTPLRVLEATIYNPIWHAMVYTALSREMKEASSSEALPEEEEIRGGL